MTYLYQHADLRIGGPMHPVRWLNWAVRFAGLVLIWIGVVTMAVLIPLGFGYLVWIFVSVIFLGASGCPPNSCQ